MIFSNLCKGRNICTFYMESNSTLQLFYTQTQVNFSTNCRLAYALCWTDIDWKPRFTQWDLNRSSYWSNAVHHIVSMQHFLANDRRMTEKAGVQKVGVIFIHHLFAMDGPIITTFKKRIREYPLKIPHGGWGVGVALIYTHRSIHILYRYDLQRVDIITKYLQQVGKPDRPKYLLENG